MRSELDKARAEFYELVRNWVHAFDTATDADETDKDDAMVQQLATALEAYRFALSAENDNAGA